MLKLKRKGGTKFRKKLQELKALSRQPEQVKVGLPQGSSSYPDGTPVVLVGAVNEFGSADGNIPERSFLRSTVIREKNNFIKFWRSEHAREILLGEESAAQVLGLLGQMAEGEVKRTITVLSEPANKESTIKQKGSSNPLIDTGLMRQSISYEGENSCA